jgi:hypothetical protein
MWLDPSGFSLRDMVGRKPDQTLFTMMNRPNVHTTLFTRRGMEFILLLMTMTIPKKCTKKEILFIYIYILGLFDYFFPSLQKENTGDTRDIRKVRQT